MSSSRFLSVVTSSLSRDKRTNNATTTATSTTNTDSSHSSNTPNVVASEDNKKEGEEMGATTTTSTTTPDNCSKIDRDPIEFTVNWSSADGEDALWKAIKNGFREEAIEKGSSDRGNDDVGVLLVFGGANGTSSLQAKTDAEVIWNVVKTDGKYKNAYKKFLFMESLPRGSAQLSFFLGRRSC